MLFLSRAEVEELLDLDELVDALARAHASLSRGEVSMPPRIAAFAENDGLLGVMPAYVPGEALACKLVTLFPQNRDRHTHQAAIMVFDHENGTPLALVDGTYITAARTAAGSALATRLLARDDARVLALLGTGVQARSHARALARVRDFEEIRVAGRSPEKAEELADEIGARAVGSYEEALRGADVVAAATHATEPVVRREWLDPGVHVNSVGFNTAGREVALTPTEYRILAYLAQHAGRVVTQDLLLEHVWGPEYVGEGHMLRVNITRLRRKLETNPSHPRYLLTRSGIGYFLVEDPDAQEAP